jgi:DNA-binding transcriptional LysR family regulator
MRKLYERVGSPAALFAFEAAARHLSFTRAAAELNVSQPAISHSVKRLEEALGAKLFVRKHRAIALTEAGERFYSDVSFGLMQILNSAERIALERQGRAVTLSVSTAFANYWMVPRLATFKANNPEIDIRLQTTDRDIDLTEEAVSLAVRRGDGRWSGYDAFLLAPERIYPVCSPAVWQRLEPPRSPQQLVGCDLIHLEEPYRPRPTWTDWFAHHGISFRDSGEGLRLNDYALVLQAAMAGEGVAMGWQHVCERLFDQKLLVPMGEDFYSDAGFWIIWSSASDLSPQAARVLDWLRSQASG